MTSRGRFAILPLVCLAITLPNVVWSQVAVAEMWPAWRVMILSALLVVAGAALVAGVAAGAVAWRRARVQGGVR